MCAFGATQPLMRAEALILAILESSRREREVQLPMSPTAAH